ncbi:MAG: tetratricopeptide repeat protein [bacterium]|nr:tetratricopeptide repeat protein [bacterium]
MRELPEGRRDYEPERRGWVEPFRALDWQRLEEVGDLHFHASAYSSALDYYDQLLDERAADEVDDTDLRRVLRKACDANILIGHYDRVEALIERAYALLAEEAELGGEEVADAVSVQRAVFQTRKAAVLRWRGRLQDSLALAKRAFSVLALTNEHTDVAILQVGMGMCHMRLGRLKKAEEFFYDGMATFRRIGHDLGVANVMNNLALMHKNRCEWDAAARFLEKALELAERIGASHLLPGLFLNQGIILLKTNRPGEARPLIEKGRRLAISLGDRTRQTRLCLVAGRLETLEGRLARAEELILEGKTLAESNRLLREVTIADEYLGDILLARGEFGKARFSYELGLEKARRIAVGNDLEGELLRRMGEAHLAEGRFDEAVAVSQDAIAVCEKINEDYELGFCHATLGAAYVASRDLTQTDHHYREAIAIFARQGLHSHWCGAILAYTDARLESSQEADLLLLRRYLMDAQENGAAAVSDLVLCDILERLARVQMRLGQHDDALLTAFELERHASGVESADLDRRVVDLRDGIETGLLGGVSRAENHLQAISDLPGLFAAGREVLPRHLETILSGSMDRVHAEVGFLAMDDGTGKLRIAARKGLTENLVDQLVRWFEHGKDGDERGTVFFSRLDAADELLGEVPALASAAGSCVMMPIALHDRRFGLIFLGRAGTSGPGFDRSALDFLATYMGFLALFLYEKGPGRGAQDTATKPIVRIESFENIITQNASMLEVLGLVRKVAPSDLTVLLTGETGTGKGLLAYSLHALSRRSKKRFLSINCAAIPETLLESELFGHKRGAFTGAHSDKRGLLAEAEGGTVFLDEVGKMPLSMQGKLLHFLDTKVVRPVGANTEFQVDVRIVCATKTDLHAMSEQGLFLEDLYYRLLDFPVTVPPLRERADDVELLSRHFVERFGRDLGMAPPALDRRFLDLLVRHSWPGNIRELEKTLKRAMVLAQDTDVLRAEHLPETLTGATAVMERTDGISPLRETMAAIECREIERAMRATRGNKSAASRMLKISYPNLLKKIKHYGIGQN